MEGADHKFKSSHRKRRHFPRVFQSGLPSIYIRISYPCGKDRKGFAFISVNPPAGQSSIESAYIGRVSIFADQAWNQSGGFLSHLSKDDDYLPMKSPFKVVGDDEEGRVAAMAPETVPLLIG